MLSVARAPKPPRDEVLSLEVLARSAPEEAEQPTQFRVLVRHFLDRFFTNELASAEGDAKTRLVQAACAIGIPGFVVALYLYTPYHMPHQVRPYWAQVGDHYFYVLYSMVAMGVVTIFEWDLLFPDLLDVFVLSPLPMRNGRMLGARVTAIFILMGAALFDSSFLAPIVLPAAADPPHLLRFWAAHLLAVAASGIFGAAFFLALEGILLGVLGDRLFRRIALWLQGFFVLVLLTLLFLYPALAGALGAVLQSRSGLVFCVPSFWFLGIYERVLEGPAVLPVFVELARIGLVALALAIGLAVASYPLAWWRKTRGLVEGTAKRETAQPDRGADVACAARHAGAQSRVPGHLAVHRAKSVARAALPHGAGDVWRHGRGSGPRDRDASQPGAWKNRVRLFAAGAARDGAHRRVLDGVGFAQHVSGARRSTRAMDLSRDPGQGGTGGS